MAMLRMIAHGRLAEVAGPVAVDIDHGLRILNFSRGVADLYRRVQGAAEELKAAKEKLDYLAKAVFDLD